MSDLLNQASLVMIPSGYKEDTVFSQLPQDGSGDMAFTRASNGTRINSAGLVEVTPWNFILQSQSFNVGSWGYTNYTLTPNSTTAPDGTLTADLFTLNNGIVAGAGSAIDQGLSQLGQITLSVYFKNNNSTGKYVIQDGNGRGIEVNVVTLAFTNLSSAVGSVESVGNGWYRIITTITQTSSYYFYSYQDGMTGDGSKGIYLWGAQLNIGSTAKPYFPTTDRLNVPRLTYQNGGGGCPSLLLEKQRTNLCTYSQDFSNAVWNTSVDSGCSVTITPNYTTASNGLPAARLVASRTSTSTIAALVNYSPNTGTTATKSIWMKNNNSGNVTIMFGDEAVTITDSWERYSITNTYLYSIVGLRYSGVALSCDISITGSQFELGAYPTSYIPTTSSSATRVADACFKTGISSLIGQTEGTIFLDAYFDDLDTVNFSISDGTSGNYILIDSSSGAVVFARVQQGGVTQATINTSASFYTVGARLKCAIAYKANDFAFYINGTLIGTDNSGSVPACDQIRFARWNGVVPATQRVNEVITFKTRLTNAELAQLTA